MDAGLVMAMEGQRLSGSVVLVVEDEVLVGLDVVQALSACGAQVVSASRMADAIAAIDQVKISAAVLDINLGGVDCSGLCRHLSERRIPFAFHTGYAAAPDGWSEVPIIKKPAHRADIVDTVERLCRSDQGAD